jgi:hypothetical protein
MVILLYFLIALIFSENEREISRNRAAYHSSCSDYFHTGHLVTNGLYNSTGFQNYWESGGKSNVLFLI